MAKTTVSAILAGGLILFAGLQEASAGIFSFFHRSDCDRQECCNECECECEEKESEGEHCCCFCPPCPPEGLFAYSVVPIELNGVASLPQNAKPPQDNQAKAPDQNAAPTPPPCTLEEVCKRQIKMEEELVKLDKDLTELTASVRDLVKKVKAAQQNGDAPPPPAGDKK